MTHSAAHVVHLLCPVSKAVFIQRAPEDALSVQPLAGMWSEQEAAAGQKAGTQQALTRVPHRNSLRKARAQSRLFTDS